MLQRKRNFAWPVRGTVFAAALIFAPTAFAQGYGDAGYRYHWERAYGGSNRAHHHRHIAVQGAHSRYANYSPRHHHRYIRAAYLHGARSEMAYEQRQYRRPRLIEASYLAREHHEVALEARREELEAADDRERPITAELNLVQLRQGRERAAEIAQWQLRYGAAANG